MPKVAPIQIVIIPIFYSKDDEEKILKKSNDIKTLLRQDGIRVHIDSRQELTPGYKFHDWELKGVPIRIEIGPKDIQNQKAVLVTRHNKEKSSHSFEGLNSYILSQLEIIQKDMLAAATKILEENIKDAKSYSEFQSLLDEGGFIRAHWCGDQKCEEQIKKETGADIRVIPFDKDDIGECIICQRQSESVPFFARGY